jgi:ABC-type sugar transport system ATPase subunit
MTISIAAGYSMPSDLKAAAIARATPKSAPAAAPLIQVFGLTKRFPGVSALTEVDFDLATGEIHAVLGENGAGKSTLIKVITGLEKPDAGRIHVNGFEVDIHGPRAAQRLGISLVPQDILVVPGLSIGRNILLGHERPFCRESKLTVREVEMVQVALMQVGAKFDHATPAARLSAPDLRLAQIARTLIRPGKIIVLDEPTAVLSEPDAELLLERLLSFRSLGKGIIYISHRLSEVMRIADRATVLRDGRRVAQFRSAEFDRGKLLSAMARLEATRSPAIRTPEGSGHQAVIGEVQLKVSGLCMTSRFENVGFSARAGEIVGIAGVQGSGHGHLLRGLSGLERWTSGEVELCKQKIAPGSVKEVCDAGLTFISADRRKSAIVPQSNLQDNLVLSPRSSRECRRFGFRLLLRERSLATRLMSELSINPPLLGCKSGTLSGGNQQKLALARTVGGDAKVLLLEEPTQGVDIRSKGEIHALIKRFAAEQDRAVVVASSEFEELLNLADIIHVMCLGRLVISFRRGEATYRKLLHHALP